MNKETRRAITTAESLVSEARAILQTSPARSDSLTAEAWHVLEHASRFSRERALVTAWVSLARFILHELGPAALAHGPNIGNNDARNAWYSDSIAMVRSVLAGRRALRARGHLARGDFDEMSEDEERDFLAGLEAMTKAAVA